MTPLKTASASAVFSGLLVLVCCNLDPEARTIEGMQDGIAALPAVARGTVTGSRAFEEFFRLAGTITLSSEAPVGQVNDVDIGPGGSILITDGRAREVLLFSGDGRLIRRLSADACHPGLSWSPLMARFTPAGEILALLDGQPDFYFSGSGTCQERMDAAFLPPRLLGFTISGSILGYYANPAESYISRMSPSGKEITRFGQTMRGAGLASRIRSGELVTDHAGFVYLLPPLSPHVHKYDRHGRLVGLLGPTPSYYRKITGAPDIAAGNPAVAEMLRDKLNAASISANVFMLSRDTLLVQYFNNYKATERPDEQIGLMLLDTQGNPLIDHEIQTGNVGKLLLARHGLAYRAVHPERDLPEEMLGFKIEMYRFAPPARLRQ